MKTMKRGSTHILRLAILTIAAIVFTICIFVLPVGINNTTIGGYSYILLGLYVPAVPFFIALYQAMKLLGLIDRNKAFSDAAIGTLKNIKYCALAISALFTAGMPYVYGVAQLDDAPGVVLIGLVIIFASFVIAGFAAVLQKLLQNAKEIKSENDLTV